LTSDKPLPEHAFPSSSVPAASKGAVVSLSFDRGQPVAIDGKVMDPVDVLAELNALGSTHRVGRGMHVGDTIIGIKGRVAFEAPAAHIVIEAHRQLEKHTLSKWQINLKDQLSLWYGQLLHEGQFLDPAMRSMEAFFDETQRMVTGKVDVRLELGRIAVEGIRSPFDLMNADFASYGEDHAAWSPADARGFAAIAAIATRLHKERSS
jgi:argininosuccinate synthase